MIKEIRKSQKGVVTIITAVVLMLAVFGISYFLSETVINEAQVSANDYRSKQAFFAAQAGVDFYRTLEDSQSCTAAAPCFKTLADQSSYEIKVTEVVSNSLFSIRSLGTSPDGSVQRTITYAIGKLPGEIYPPKVPIVAKGGLGLTGNVKAVNNKEPLTVWSGSDFVAGGSANTYIKIDSNENQLSTIKTPGGNNISGPDVITGDPNLGPSVTSAALLSAFFGVNAMSELASENDKNTDGSEITLESYDIEKNWDHKVTFYSSGDIDLQSSYLDSREVPEKSIEAFGQENWDSVVASSTVAGNGFKTNGFYIGSPSSPVVIASEGTVTIGSGVVVFGVIIADKVVLQGGNPEIVGGMVVLNDGSDAMTGVGNPTVIMDELIIDKAFDQGAFGPVKSSWKDW